MLSVFRHKNFSQTQTFDISQKFIITQLGCSFYHSTQNSLKKQRTLRKIDRIYILPRKKKDPDPT